MANTRPSLTSLHGSGSGVNPGVVTTRAASGNDLFTGGSLSLGNVPGTAGVVHVPVVSGIAPTGGNIDGVMQRLTQLVQTQTEMVAGLCLRRVYPQCPIIVERVIYLMMIALKSGLSILRNEPS